MNDQRLLDLVRQQRVELLTSRLITEEEYARLASVPGSVARLESYDDMRASLTRLERERAEAVAMLRRMDAAETDGSIHATLLGISAFLARIDAAAAPCPICRKTVPADAAHTCRAAPDARDGR